MHPKRVCPKLRLRHDGGTMQTRYKMTMGLEPMDPNELIEIDEHYDAEMALRRQMLADIRDTVLQTSEKVRACALHSPHAALHRALGRCSTVPVPSNDDPFNNCAR